MGSAVELRIGVFEDITRTLKALFAGCSDEQLAAFTAERMGRETQWVQQIAWDEIRAREEG